MTLGAGSGSRTQADCPVVASILFAWQEHMFYHVAVFMGLTTLTQHMKSVIAGNLSTNGC